MSNQNSPSSAMPHTPTATMDDDLVPGSMASPPNEQQPSPPHPPNVPVLAQTQTGTTDADETVPPMLCLHVLGEDEDNNCPFYIGQRFDDETDMAKYVTTYAATLKLDILLQRSSKKRQNRNFDNCYLLFHCSRGRKPKSGKVKGSAEGGDTRPKRVSLKCNCGMSIRAGHPMNSENTKRLECYEIISFSLEHTNGCNGYDELIQSSIKQRRGRKYSAVALDHIKTEVVAGRYSTTDVKGWLIEQGYKDACLEEATNLRYRLMKSLPIKDWKESDVPNEEMGTMQDYLFNADLAKEIKAGDLESVKNLQLIHRGLRSQVEGYDSRITTDSENRFSGTTWKTGRMRTRLRRHVRFIFVDDSRSGISSSGFCFWNICIVDQDRKIQVVMGAMTMHPTNDSIQWIFFSLVSMTPEAVEIVKGLMSDLGKVMIFVNTICGHICLTLSLINIHRSYKSPCPEKSTSCEILWSMHLAYYDN